MEKATVKFLGTVALVRVPKESGIDVEQLAAKIMEKNRAVKTVLQIEKVDGVFRVPVVRHVAGCADTQTIVREDGIVYKLDAAKLMFSLGNSFERRRMRRIPEPGEVVVDMFAGVGQFTIPVAKSAASHVHAFELNPVAYQYLVENIRLNHVEEKVSAYNVDCRKASETGLAGKADRVLMGYLWGTVEFIETAYRLVKPTGGVIHFHEVGETVGGWTSLYEKCQKAAEKLGYRVELLGKRVVKTYSPKFSHWVLDLRVRRQPFPEPSRHLGEEATP
ncbi:MAG: class I SAM-dependent methyltransferase family protein [Candidatus Caldarchaeum sp.]|nr:class I SAM-dependent methyltransferase family protein [Candidatus Caldarchaeum sp.]